jgi:hypothetical protein
MPANASKQFALNSNKIRLSIDKTLADRIGQEGEGYKIALPTNILGRSRCEQVPTHNLLRQIYTGMEDEQRSIVQNRSARLVN